MNSRSDRSQKAIQELKKIGLSLSQIVEMCDNRFTTRTLRRWEKGSTPPSRESDVESLERLVEQCRT